MLNMALIMYRLYVCVFSPGLYKDKVVCMSKIVIDVIAYWLGDPYHFSPLTTSPISALSLNQETDK